jgi:Domain of unknown function (DUF4440)
MFHRNRSWIVVATMLAMAFAVGAQQARWAAAGDQTAQSLIELERKWAEADCDGNLSMQNTLADDFQGTAPDNSRYSKAQEIEETKTAKSRGTGCRLGETTVHFFGDHLAVLYGTESRIRKAADGIEQAQSLVWTDTWLKRNGRWQIIAAQDNWANQQEK